MKPTLPQYILKNNGPQRRRVIANGATSQAPKAANVSTESAIERRCKEYAARYGCLLWKITAVTGAPDRLCILPNGRHFFVEFKKPGGEMSAIQRHIQSHLVNMRHACFEIDNRHLFERILHEQLSLPAV
jgi:hypothetical protein